jgi:hypothetical protein
VLACELTRRRTFAPSPPPRAVQAGEGELDAKYLLSCTYDNVAAVDAAQHNKNLFEAGRSFRELQGES